MTSVWENPESGDLISHLRKLRRKKQHRTGAVGARGCSSCRGLLEVVVVDGEHRVVYSEPCLACGGGSTETARTPA